VLLCGSIVASTSGGDDQRMVRGGVFAWRARKRTNREDLLAL